MALRSFESEYDSEIPAYFVDLIQNRELSNFIATTTDIRHQSPQVISIKNGKPVYAESHHSISAVSASSL
jgi:bacillithiol system protein YtxJ